ncbi:MAG: DUF4296 domain-containing protein [Sphingobacteriales bacterium]|nr:MAG: DUF4296 domain-containing protein [Sphingobacteriales bacterium]
MRYWLFVFVLAIPAACNSGDKLPESVLPPARMAEIMKQVIAADEWVNWRKEHEPSLDADTERIRRYRAALRSAGITEQQYKSSFAYYQAHPKALRMVFDTLQKHPNIDTGIITGKKLIQIVVFPVDGMAIRKGHVGQQFLNNVRNGFPIDSGQFNPVRNGFSTIISQDPGSVFRDIQFQREKLTGMERIVFILTRRNPFDVAIFQCHQQRNHRFVKRLLRHRMVQPCLGSREKGVERRFRCVLVRGRMGFI